MTQPFAGTRLLLIARFDDAFNAHNALRRRALERLGCAVTVVDPHERGLLDRLRRLDLEGRIALALRQANPEIVLTIRGEGLGREQIRALRKESGARWVNWFPDDIRALGLIQQVADLYDRVFVTGSDLVAALQAGRHDGVRYLPLGCDPSFHRPMRSRGPFRANVVFAGTATPRREEFLSLLVEFGLALWGPGWRKTTLKDYCRGELGVAEDYVRAYAGATVAVNIHQSLDSDPARDIRSCNARLFEVAAIGICQVVDARADLGRHFEDNAEILVCQNPGELKGLVKRALENNPYRERLAANARHRALREHTYMHRMAELLSSVSGKQTAVSGER